MIDGHRYIVIGEPDRRWMVVGVVHCRTAAALRSEALGTQGTTVAPHHCEIAHVPTSLFSFVVAPACGRIAFCRPCRGADDVARTRFQRQSGSSMTARATAPPSLTSACMPNAGASNHLLRVPRAPAPARRLLHRRTGSVVMAAVAVWEVAVWEVAVWEVAVWAAEAWVAAAWQSQLPGLIEQRQQ